jgi:hypothetical protein
MSTTLNRKDKLIELAKKARASMRPEFKALTSDDIMYFIRGEDERVLAKIRIKMKNALL